MILGTGLNTGVANPERSARRLPIYWQVFLPGHHLWLKVVARPLQGSPQMLALFQSRLHLIYYIVKTTERILTKFVIGSIH
jgi:hypothetical protein